MISAREWSRGGKADVCTTQSPAHASSVSSAFASFLDRGEGLADGAAGGCFEDSRRDARRGVIGIFAASGTCRQALVACNEWQELLRLLARRVNFFGR